MTRDPIVEEVRAVREAIAKEHNNDLAAICEAFRAMGRASGVARVTLEPRPVSASNRETAAQQIVAPDEASPRR